MKAATVNELKDELKHLPAGQLLELKQNEEMLQRRARTWPPFEEKAQYTKKDWLIGQSF